MTRKGRRLALGAAAASALLVAWFLGVDSCRYVENCLDCRQMRAIDEVRVATVPVRTSERDAPSLITAVADDLGAPCPHDRANRYRARRRLGLLIAVESDPVLIPLHRPWYPPCAREGARALIDAEPGLSAAFRRRVLEGHDWDYWRALHARIFAGCPPDQRPGDDEPGPPEEDAEAPSGPPDRGPASDLQAADD